MLFLGGGILLTPMLVPAFLLIVAVAIAIIVLVGRERVAKACRARPWTATGLAIVGGTHAFIVAASVHLFLQPPGSSVRPMGWAVACFGASLLGLLGVGAISIFNKERGAVLWVVTMLGALAAFFLGPMLLQLASWIVGFDISD